MRPDQYTEIIVQVRIRPDKRFTRSGSDLRTTVEVPYLDAILGGEVLVPTMTGSVALTVPAGTPNGKVFRLADHLRRLETAARAVGIDLPGGCESIEKIVLETARAHGRDEATIRVALLSLQLATAVRNLLNAYKQQHAALFWIKHNPVTFDFCTTNARARAITHPGFAPSV